MKNIVDEGIIYGTGTGNMILGLDKIVDEGTTIIELPKHYFFKNGKLKKKYFKRTTYPRLK